MTDARRRAFPQRKTTLARWSWVLLLLACCGCRSVAGPNWYNPGTARDQRLVAEMFDPYPENETGPPVIGGRPRAFVRPIPEIPRMQWHPWGWNAP